ncbi:MAG: hypothetical protein WCI85_15275 [Comamonadaceae bacterium]
MTIHQLQASYVLEQDRILVRMNTLAGEELRLWLTRRMVRNLFPHMLQVTADLVADQAQGASHDGADRNALTQFKKQESLQKADFHTPFNSQAASLPIGDAPLLASRVHVTVCDGGALRIGFEEDVADAATKRSFEVTLGQDLLHGFMHLLEAALQQADWGITLEPGTAGGEPLAADAFANAKPPQYLN